MEIMGPGAAPRLGCQDNTCNYTPPCARSPHAFGFDARVRLDTGRERAEERVHDEVDQPHQECDDDLCNG